MVSPPVPPWNLASGFLRNFDLVSLRLLLSAVEQGNLARVASRENISLSAVSRRISDLEARIGVKLLLRHDRGVSPTDATLANLHRLRSLFLLIDQMAEDFGEINSGRKGVVRVQAHLTAITGALPEYLATFAAAHPDIQVVVDESNSQDVVHAVQVGGCDLGFVSGTVDTAMLEVFPWKMDRLAVIMPRGHPLEVKDTVSFAQLLDFPFVGMAADSSLQTLFRGQAAALSRTLNEVVRVSTFEGVRDMVNAGMGVGMLPLAGAAREAGWPGVTARPLDERWADRPLLICVRDRSQMTAAARKFLDHSLGHG